MELAGAIGEMSRFTLARDFRSINATSAKVILLEAGPRILPSFSEKLTSRAIRDLDKLGVEVRTSCKVTSVDADGVQVDDQRLPAATVLWAAGVRASSVTQGAGVEVDAQGRVVVQPDLSIAGVRKALCPVSPNASTIPLIAP